MKPSHSESVVNSMKDKTIIGLLSDDDIMDEAIETVWEEDVFSMPCDLLDMYMKDAILHYRRLVSSEIMKHWGWKRQKKRQNAERRRGDE